jgi:hypothetical protein
MVTALEELTEFEEMAEPNEPAYPDELDELELDRCVGDNLNESLNCVRIGD